MFVSGKILSSMKSTPRKYQKHKAEGKITVKHFFNTRLKGKTQESGVVVYPLYVRIMVKGQLTDIKSRLTQLVDPHSFDLFENDYSAFLQQEIKDITSIVKDLKPFDKQDFNLQTVTSLYSQSATPITTIIENCLKDEVRYCIAINYPEPSHNVDMNDKAVIIALAQDNELISLIDWQKSSYMILTSLQTIIPSLFDPLRKLEIMYGPAFSFDGYYNTLYATHRYPVKPTLTDWKSGSLKRDINNPKVISSIDLLLKNHYSL